MRKLRVVGVLAIAALAATALAATGTPDVARATGSALAGESFEGATVTDSRWLALGSACLTAATSQGSGGALGACASTTNSPTIGATPGYLQLSDDSNNVSSSVLYNRPLPSAAGIDVDFDTYQYGSSSPGADGIGFFLTDGAYTLSAAGPNGGSLGYSGRADTGVGGVAHGYLGVGLDVYGNNSNVPQYQGTGCTTITSHAKTPESVVVRGAGDGTAGYCVLSTTPVATVQSGATLDSSSTTASVSSMLASSKRNVRITVSPTTTANPYPTVQTFIDFSGTATNYVLVSSVVLPTAPPTTFKLGFSASTGGKREAHLIQGVNVNTVNPVGAVSLASQIDHSGTGTTATTFTAGDTLPVQFTVTATGTDPLSNIVVSDPDVTNISCPSTTLAVADSMTCTGTRVLNASDANHGTYSTTATVMATAGSSTVTSSSTVTAPTYLAALSVAQVANPTAVTASGQTVTFTSTVTNTGTVALGTVALQSSSFGGSGPLSGPTCGATTLAVGASTTCTATYTSTQADTEAGTIAETVRATATYNGTAVSPATATSTVTASSLPALTITATGTPTTITTAGQSVDYSFLVTNTGNRALHGIAVPVDSFTGTGTLGTVSCPSPALAVGAQETCTVPYVATQDDVDAGTTVLTTHASGTTSAGTAVSSTTATVTESATHGAAVDMTASATPSTITAAGQRVQFAYVVTNTGNVTLHAVSVQPTAFTGSGTASTPVCNSTTLAVGASETCLESYTVAMSDIVGGGFSTTADAVGHDGSTVVHSADRTTPVTAEWAPALTLRQTASSVRMTAAGKRVAFSYTVSNTGNIPLGAIEIVTQSFSGSGAPSAISCPATWLDAGASQTCTSDYTVTQPDMDAGWVTKTAMATGSMHGTAVASAASTVKLASSTDPLLTVTITTGGVTAERVGQVITYSFQVANVGPITAMDPTVTNATVDGAGRMSSVRCPQRSALAPGATMTCTATYRVRAADVGHTLVATAGAAATAPNGTRAIARPATAIVRVATDSSAASLAFTGAGWVGTMTGAAALLALVLAGLVAVSLLRRRRAL